MTSPNATLADIVGALASGARIALDDELYPALVLPAPHIDGPTWDRLLREGWLASTANGGGYKLSDAGYLAYVRSVDELRNDGLVAPIAALHTDGAPHDEP